MWKYCTYTVQIIYKFGASIKQILRKYCANKIIYYSYITQLLFKYQTNIEPILSKKTYNNHANIAQTLWKYCLIIVKTLLLLPHSSVAEEDEIVTTPTQA